MSNQTENRICKNCTQDFIIESADFSFYEKIKVPAPTWCPECRLIRRFSFNNVWSLYRRDCAKCGKKNMMSTFSPDKKCIVYCPECWWSDDWDGTEKGLEYDSARPFLEQMKELLAITPWQGLESAYLTLVNSDYTNACAYQKNSYMTFWADYCENVFYSSYLNGLKDSLDCYRMYKSELCYEDVGCGNCYRTFFSEECDSCTDSWFCRSCFGCTNCFGCINLRNRSYCIFNIQYSKDEYFAKLKELNLESNASIADIKRQVLEFWNQYPRRMYTGNSLNVQVTGDYIYESKNAKDCYMVSGAEDCRYVQFISVASAKDCYDYTGWGNGAELVYEGMVVGEGASNVKFGYHCWPNVLNVEYCMYAIACKNSFGCVNLKRKEYCILNKQYSKEEYERLVAHIKEDMVLNPYVDEKGREWPYGEFLPVGFSPYAYNESVAAQFFPKTKEEVEIYGAQWVEPHVNQYTITKKAHDLPDTIKETDDSVVNEVIECSECTKPFRIVPNELSQMRKLDLPLPHSCYNCRQSRRFKRTNPPRLYDRNCQNCNTSIKTTYAPDRSEIVYCEKCYQEAMM
jgi:hypothetical protein